MNNSTNLSTLGEFGLINRIVAAVACASSGAGVITGIGDDAAVTALSPGMQLLTSTDMLLEDVHFRRSWHDPYRLGRKSLAVSISDIAAMGGIPRWSLLSLAIPGDLPLDFIDEFTKGFLSMAAEQRVVLIGGDTCASKAGLVISVTIMGEQAPELILRRNGACVGDEIWVTGNLGDAALGLRILESPELDNFLSETQHKEYLLSRLLDPTPRTAAGIALAEAGLISAMIDISDGILADYGHIAELSGVGGTLTLAAVPLSSAFRSAASVLADFPHHLCLTGGEDYELCFTAPPCNHEKISNCIKKCGIEATRVGIVSSLPEVTILNQDGTIYIPAKTGFNHFI